MLQAGRMAEGLICANEDCLSKAFKNKGLERSFKMAVDSAVYDELAKELNNIGK